MLKKAFSIIFLLSIHFVCLSVCYSAESSSLKELSSELVHQKIKSITIIAVSPGLFTSRPITSEQLEEFPDYKVEIRASGIDHYRDSLIKAIQSTETESKQGGVDLRSGLFFYDDKGQRVCTILLDRSGKHGFINKQQVSFSVSVLNTGLAYWLNSNFPFK